MDEEEAVDGSIEEEEEGEEGEEDEEEEGEEDKVGDEEGFGGAIFSGMLSLDFLRDVMLSTNELRKRI